MKKVLITGGNKGIGLETTKKFLRENDYEIYVVGRDFAGFESEAKIIEFDLNNTKNLIQIKEETGNIDILVNNAGIMHTHNFDEYPEKDKERIRNVNLETPLELIKLYSDGMKDNEFGRIVNVCSIAAHIGHPDIWYGMTKAALLNLTKSIAKILGPHGIVTNAVAPGPVDTDMLQRTIPQDRQDQLKKAAILNRVAKPEEIAETIFWLSTDSPEYINGVCIDLNNGSYMR
jgi:3-oxoacyl-[acyl-carrier protein] reductase